jgi:glycerol-3-phosphate dehydrogenase (NAD(P)+)
MASLLARNGHQVIVLAIEPEIVESINTQHRNAIFMTKYTLHPNIKATLNPKGILLCLT